MKRLKEGLVIIGILLILFGCCFVADGELWYIPAIVMVIGLLLISIAWLLDYKEQYKYEIDEEEPIEQYPMPEPLSDWELTYLSTLRKDNKDE